MDSGDSQSASKPGERVVGPQIVAAELAFLLGPFVVIGLAYLYKGDLRNVLYTPYWSVASSVLIGQALIRFVIRLLQSNAHDPAISWEKVTLIFSLLSGIPCSAYTTKYPIPVAPAPCAMAADTVSEECDERRAECRENEAGGKIVTHYTTPSPIPEFARRLVAVRSSPICTAPTHRCRPAAGSAC